MSDETKKAATPAPDPDEEKRIWREGLVQEAMDNRPELRALGGKLDFAASRSKGHDQGFEDAARTLTPPQVTSIQALIDRRISRYTREEFPTDLQAHLAESVIGYDEAGFLAGYVDGVGDFLTELRRRMNRDD